jgi:4-amino-4-deoxy-L-arabinose transferase-like glycosyltransferase
VPALALVLHRFVFWGRYTEWSTLHIGKGMALALAIVATWGIPALVETRGMFWSVGMGEHVVARGASALNGRFPIPGYYLATAVLSLFPWITLLPQIWRRIVQRWTMTSALLVSWFLAPYLIFTFYATQLPHYVMPGFPAAMVLLARGADVRVRSSWRWWSWIVVALFAIATVAVFTSATISALPEALRPLLWHSGLALGVLAMMGALVVTGFHRPARLVYGGLVFCVLALPPCFSIVMQDIRRLHPAVQLRELTGPVVKDTRLIGWQFTEPSLVFHFDCEWRFTTKLVTVETELTKPRASLIVMLRREWTLSKALRNGGVDKDFSKEVDAQIAAYPERKLIRLEGFNAARSSWVELVALQSNTER